PEDPVPCWADRDRIAEVLDNLVSNAVKYSPGGGRVAVQVERRGEDAVVRVVDSGIGIAPTDLARLFRPFSRVRDRQTAEIEGSGLGLYICDRIVRAHGGRLWVDSTPSEGSVFSFSLPLFGAFAQTRAPVIVVGASDERTRREVRRLAEEQGYSVHEVTDGVDAVEAALRLLPVAIVLDRVLPRLRAEEAAERLKDHPTTHHVPLVVLAARGDLGDRASLFEAFIPKPLDLKVLQETLRNLSARDQPLLTPRTPGA
ncbi:MAG: ATP-binding response regulator, partial [bacterium]